MKRRRFLQGLGLAPAAGLIAQQTAPPTTELPKLEFATADAAGETVLHFFSPSEFAALRKVAGILMPAMNGGPGANEARAPEFLDFLLHESAAERQQIYRAGLDALNAQARQRFMKSFGELETAQAEELMAPLKEKWKYQPPADPAARFLMEAKVDLRTATMNSVEWNAAAKPGVRRGGATGLYWYPLD